MDLEAAVRDIVGRHPAVERVELTGSRARGTHTELSDWDFRIEGHDMDAIVRDLPALADELDPLMAMWDPLSERAVFMLITQDGVKVDLFPGDETRPIQPPWDPARDDASDIDGHFWDWTLWLGGKHLGGKTQLVGDELVKMYDHLLKPIGAAAPPATIAEAVATYRQLRDPHVDETLGSRIVDRLRGAHVL